MEQVVRRGLGQLDQQAELMRILFTDRLAAAHSMGAIPDLVFEAVAVLAIGPVVDFKIKQHLLGFTLLDLSEERLVHAWVHMFSQLFGSDQ